MIAIILGKHSKEFKYEGYSHNLLLRDLALKHIIFNNYKLLVLLMVDKDTDVVGRVTG